MQQVLQETLQEGCVYSSVIVPPQVLGCLSITCLHHHSIEHTAGLQKDLLINCVYSVVLNGLTLTYILTVLSAAGLLEGHHSQALLQRDHLQGHSQGRGSPGEQRLPGPLAALPLLLPPHGFRGMLPLPVSVSLMCLPCFLLIAACGMSPCLCLKLLFAVPLLLPPRGVGSV